MDFKDELKAIVQERRDAVKTASDNWSAIRDDVIRPVLADAEAALIELGIGGKQLPRNCNAIQLVVGRHDAEESTYKLLTFTLKKTAICVTSTEDGLEEDLDVSHLTRASVEIKVRQFFKRLALFYY